MCDLKKYLKSCIQPILASLFKGFSELIIVIVLVLGPYTLEAKITVKDIDISEQSHVKTVGAIHINADDFNKLHKIIFDESASHKEIISALVNFSSSVEKNNLMPIMESYEYILDQLNSVPISWIGSEITDPDDPNYLRLVKIIASLDIKSEDQKLVKTALIALIGPPMYIKYFEGIGNSKLHATIEGIYFTGIDDDHTRNQWLIAESNFDLAEVLLFDLDNTDYKSFIDNFMAVIDSQQTISEQLIKQMTSIYPSHTQDSLRSYIELYKKFEVAKSRRSAKLAKNIIQDAQSIRGIGLALLGENHIEKVLSMTNSNTKLQSNMQSNKGQIHEAVSNDLLLKESHCLDILQQEKI